MGDEVKAGSAAGEVKIGKGDGVIRRVGERGAWERGVRGCGVRRCGVRERDARERGDRERDARGASGKERDRERA